VHPHHTKVNVAHQERDPESLLRCYRSLLELRRERRALHGGRLELSTDTALPEDVVAYRRSHGEGAEREDVDVFLNFGERPQRLDLRGQSGRAIYSNRRSEIRQAGPEHTLGPYEGVLLF